MRGLWRPFDIASYYGLAAPASSSIYAMVDAATAPPLFPFDMGAASGYRIYVVSFFCIVTAMLVMDAGHKIYGGEAGLLAGLLFSLSITGAQGYLTAGEALALAFVLFSAHALLFHERYLLAGLCAGAAAGFKPLALLLAPAALFYMYKKGEPRGAVAFAGAALLALVLMALLAFAAYGSNAPAAAAGSGFTVAGFVADGEYRPQDALMAAANLVLAACLFASLLPLALLGYSRDRGPAEDYLLAAGLCFVATIVLKQYLHYWPFAVPFLALLCSRAFRRRPSRVE
jgi:hypothetical protein